MEKGDTVYIRSGYTGYIKNSKEAPMSKKQKEKVRRLTEEEYEEYIRSLQENSELSE